MKWKKWFRMTVMIPLVLFLIITNVYEDPASIYHDYTSYMAEAILDGEQPFFYSGNGDERGVKQHLIENMPKHVECVTVGPSLTLEINKDNVGTDSYYNLSFGRANFNDYMALFALMELNEVKADRIIFCVDTYFFNDYFADMTFEPRWEPYTQYMKSKLDGENPEPVSGEVSFFSEENFNKIYDYAEQSVSITYFQSSCHLIKKNHSFLQKERCGIIDESTKEYAHYMPDGSWVYSAEYRSKDIDDTLVEINSINLGNEFAIGNHVGQDKVEYFDKLIDYLIENGIEVEFFLCPLPPSLWDRFEFGSADCQFYIFDEIEEHTLEVAEKYDIKVTGSLNPYNVGIQDEDFWDSRHVKTDKLDVYFDFK